MRLYKTLGFFVCLTVLLVPLLALPEKEPDSADSQDETGQSETTEQTAADTVKLLLTDEQRVVELDLQEYLVGVLAAEMSPAYHEQALRAQAVAAYTYLLYRRQAQTAAPDESLSGADLSDDSSTHQGYLSAEKRAEKWGEKTESYEKKLVEAVENVKGKRVVYEGKPIMAAFHAINSGNTQSAKTVWGGEVEYLQSVTSPGDKLSPDCVKSVAVTSQEFSQAVSSLVGCQLSGGAESWIEEIKTNTDGYVASVTVGGEAFTGLQLRTALGLRSAVFTCEYKDSGFYFTTTGYGHCVGLSQYGADYMARQGSSWEEILLHYYPGTQII